MNDIIRKQMKDVIAPQNDVIRRPPIVPEPYIAPLPREEWSRIEKNPFFEKPQSKNNGTGPQSKKEPRTRGILWALLFALLLVAGFFVANYFAKATIEFRLREAAQSTIPSPH